MKFNMKQRKPLIKLKLTKVADKIVPINCDSACICSVQTMTVCVCVTNWLCENLELKHIQFFEFDTIRLQF